jgi:hypothetical protein
MPQLCTICGHPDRASIEAELVAGSRSFRSLASLYAVSEAALRRHKANHLPETLARAQEAQQAAHGDNLLTQVRELHERARSILSTAEKARDWPTALKAIREARGCLELLGRLMGELQEGQTTNVLVLPEWISIRSVLVESLAPYPDARAAVAGALERLGNAGQ